MKWIIAILSIGALSIFNGLFPKLMGLPPEITESYAFIVGYLIYCLASGVFVGSMLGRWIFEGE